MLRLAVIGGGVHCSQNHLPALACYMKEHPGRIQLAAFCDRDPAVVDRVSKLYPFSSYYSDIDMMLRYGTLDGCIAITPVEQTAAVAVRILEANVPLLMEKPPGSNLGEALLICQAGVDTGTPVMVSMDRRFDPVLLKARKWLEGRLVTGVDVSLCRKARNEMTFFRDTAIHAVDTIRFIAGEIIGYSAEVSVRNNVRSYRVAMHFESGAKGVLHVDPNCGRVEERYAFSGPGWSLTARSGSLDAGSLEIQEEGNVIHFEKTPGNLPGFVRNGTLNETSAFIEALINGTPPEPSLSEVVGSVRCCNEIQALAHD